jgi:hypothetical protein
MMISGTAIQLDRHAHPPPSRIAPRPPTVDPLHKIGHRAPTSFTHHNSNLIIATATPGLMGMIIRHQTSNLVLLGE